MTMLKSRLPCLILLFGAVLRIATLGSAALWYDEAVTLYRTGLPLLQLFSNKSEGSGDLFLELLLRPAMAIDAHSLWLLRLPALLAGLISLWLVWLLMQRLQFNWQQQCLAAVFAAFLPGLIWLGQDARAYGLLACLLLAALWFALESRWLGLGACCGLMIYCHSTGPAFALGVLVIAYYLYPWKVRSLLISAACIGLAWLPAAYRILQDGGSLSYAWGNTSTLELWIVSGFAAAWTKIPTIPFFIGCAVLAMTLCLLLTKIKGDGRIVSLLAWSIPLVGMMLFSLYRNVIIYRTLMPLLFPFVLWLAWELGATQDPHWLRFPLVWAWIAFLIAGMLCYHPAERGGGLDQVAAQIRSQWRTGDQLVYATITVGLPFEYYLGDLPQDWLHIVHNPLLVIPAIPHSVKPCPDSCRRFWVVIPDEQYLISPAEWASLSPYIRGQPVYSVKLMQASTINVYLVDINPLWMSLLYPMGDPK
jgi:hypothetical protein